MGTYLPVYRSFGSAARRTLTLAAAVSLLAAPLVPASASAADAPVKLKVAKIAPKAFPLLLDRPGTSEDMLRFTQVAGIEWSVGAAKVAFTGKTADVKVAGGTNVAVTAMATDSYLISGPTAWTYSPTNVAKEYTEADINAALTWVDLPATKADAVVLTKLDGVTWSIGTAKYDETKFGTKTSLTVKLKTGDAVTPTPVGATLTAGAATPRNLVTADPTLEYSTDQLTAAAVVGDNPLDETKGVGKGASVETVKVTGLAGVSWRVGSSPKAVSVKPGVVAYLPVPAHDVDGASVVNVLPIAATGFTLPMTGDKATPIAVDFADTTAARVVTVQDAKTADRSGTVADILTLPGARGMTWYAGQLDARGKLTYKALKADKSGNAVYKVKHGKDGETVAVSYRAVPDRGYQVSRKAVQTAPFTRTETSVVTPTVTSGAVTLNHQAPGVASWEVTSTVAGKAVKSVYKPADLTAVGATWIVVLASTIDIKVIKGYKKA